jgi:hypothetical protein
MLFFPADCLVLLLSLYQSLLFFHQFDPLLVSKHKSFVVFAAEEKFNKYRAYGILKFLIFCGLRWDLQHDILLWLRMRAIFISSLALVVILFILRVRGIFSSFSTFTATSTSTSLMSLFLLKGAFFSPPSPASSFLIVFHFLIRRRCYFLVLGWLFLALHFYYYKNFLSQNK